MRYAIGVALVDVRLLGGISAVSREDGFATPGERWAGVDDEVAHGSLPAPAPTRVCGVGMGEL